MSKNPRFILAAALLAVSLGASAATDWSIEDYDLYPGDFNGDNKTDVLYVAKAAGRDSGIALSDGVAPNIDLQKWPGNHLGLQWYGNLFRPVVGDYNADGRADVLMHRQLPGNHYVILANQDGTITAIAQEIANSYLGLVWSGDAHRIISGDFNADLRGDLFLQATTPSGLNAIVFANSSGQFTGSGGGAHQSWNNDYLGFKWSVSQAIVHAGDFSGDGRDDLLVQAKPDIVLIDYDIPFPVPKYRTNGNGLLIAKIVNGSNEVFYGLDCVVRRWTRYLPNTPGIDWSASHTNIIIGDYDGNNRDDIFLQARSAGRTNSLFITDSTGNVTDADQLTDANVRLWTGDSYRLIAANFDASAPSGMYLQANTRSGTNYIAASITGSGVTVAVHDPFQFLPSVRAGTATGWTPGEFAVDPSGTAAYSVPINVPPGVSGVAAKISLQYSSRGGNGLLGVGWSLAGLSAISRCPASFEPDGFSDAADFDGNDRFCLDGQRLLRFSGASYGAVGAEYRTEIESFQKIVSTGGVAGDPASFTVWDKAGLIRDYGTTADSRVEAQGRADGQAFAWAIRRIRDRFDNFIAFTYAEDAANTSQRPATITYGNRNGTVVGKIVFEYPTQDRPDKIEGYSAGSRVGQSKLLTKISVYARPDQNASGPTAADGTKVRDYFLGYEKSPTTGLSHLKSIVECDASGLKCFRPASFRWQHGQRGFKEMRNLNIPVSELSNLRLTDINADGKTDYLYTKKNASNVDQWWFKWNTPQTGGINTNITATNPSHAYVIDYNSDGYVDLLQASGSSPANYEWLRGNASGTFWPLPQSTTISAEGLSGDGRKTAVADVNGDGRQDVAYLRNTSGDPQTNNEVVVNYNGPNGLTLGADTDLGTYTCDISTDNPGIRTINFDGDAKDDLLVPVALTWGFGQPQGEEDPPIIVFTCGLRVYSYVDNALQPVWTSTAVTANNMKVIDVNGDAISDLLFFDGSYWRVWKGTGAGYVSSWSGSTTSYTQAADVDWNYFVSGHLLGPQPTTTVNVTLTAAMLKDSEIVDYNRDGKADVMISHLATWQVLLSDGSGFPLQLLSTGRAATQADKASLIEETSDGLADILFPSGLTINDTWRVYDQRVPAVSAVIDRITDGLGATIEVQYLPMTDVTVYRGHTGLNESGGADPAFPLTNIGAPLPLVYKFLADNGKNGGGVWTTYEYKGLKAHRAGRGLLGFSYVKAWNDNSKIETHNWFAQTFPYTGMVWASEQKLPDYTTFVNAVADDSTSGLRLGYAASCDIPGEPCEGEPPPPPTVVTGNKVTRTDNVLWYHPSTYGSYFPYIQKSTALVYPLRLNPEPQPAARKRTVMEYFTTAGATPTPDAQGKPQSSSQAYDAYGNPSWIKVSVDDGAGGDLHTTVTKNYFTNPDTGSQPWCLGRLQSTSVDNTRPNYGESENTGAIAATRVSSFVYASDSTCALTDEIVEPDVYYTVTGTVTNNPNNIPSSTSPYRLQRHFERADTFGNITSETVSGADVTSRTSTTAFDPQGQFPITTTNALGHSETRHWNTLFGVADSVTGPNALTATVAYDSLGRQLRETAPQTTITKDTEYRWCAGAPTCYSSRAVYSIKKTASDGGRTITEYDRLAREVLVRTVSFDGRELWAEKHYDALGRSYSAALPYFSDAPKKCYGLQKYDALGRVVDSWTPENETQCSANTNGPDAPPFAPNSSLPSGGMVIHTKHDEVHPGGFGTMTTVDNLNGSTVTDANGRVTRSAANVMDRVRSVEERLAAPATYLQTRYGFDAAGNKTWIRNHKGNQTHIAFSPRGFKTQMSDPDMGTWTYGVDVLGHLRWQKDAKQQGTSLRTDLDYDVLGRMTTRTEPAEGTTTWTYDDLSGMTGSPKAKGKLTRVVGPDGFEERYKYDATFGYPEHTARKIDGTWHWLSNTYDSLGRVDLVKYPNTVSASSETSAGADSDRVRVRNNYNGYGFLASVQEISAGGATGTVYWTANGVDQFGHVRQETFGNAKVTTRTYELATGALKRIETGAGVIANIQNNDYEWDAAGNLTQRIERFTPSGGGSANTYKERFAYDPLYRLKTVEYFSTESAGTPSRTDQPSYDEIGNLLQKDAQFTGYDYGTRTGCTNTVVRPHAVYKVNAGGTNRQYCYDANGNVVSVSGNSAYTMVTWTNANLVKVIEKASGNRSEFWYSPDRARYKHSALKGSVTETTVYVGGLYERQTASGSSTVSHVHYLSAAGAVIGIIKKLSTGTTELRYAHRDHLGSISVLSKPDGSVDDANDRFGYDAWGKRRDALTRALGTPGTFLSAGFTPRGFTGHEHMDHVGLVNMNGRVYDPEIGKFLSADPLGDGELSQSLNRYSYVNNNPLSFTDPSGFRKASWLSQLFFAIVGIVVTVFMPQSGGAIWNALAGALGEGGALAAVGFSVGFVSGFMTTGSVRTGFLAGSGAALTSGIGSAAGSAKGVSALLQKSVLHGLTQGVLSASLGGRFQDGFLGGFAGSIAGGLAASESFGPVGGFIVTTVIGGTVSAAAGGSFANGAASAAFVYLFNDLSHRNVPYRQFRDWIEKADIPDQQKSDLMGQVSRNRTAALKKYSGMTIDEFARALGLDGWHRRDVQYVQRKLTDALARDWPEASMAEYNYMMKSVWPSSAEVGADLYGTVKGGATFSMIMDAWTTVDFASWTLGLPRRYTVELEMCHIFCNSDDYYEISLVPADR